ncbi:DNA methylase [Shigella flexneri K-227]|uniref:DNA methylase n=1 Tax=Shigella flexneri K-227 TaxID=766147 RepID=F5P4Y9_SHIFL|nr:DNA methylase [Shigella flexneri K-227]EGK31061.1 DNA methylase [Shigella flexneri K-227]
MSRFVLGNCIDVMARIPDNAIDFILTDPPYLVGFRDRQGRTIAGDKTDEWLQPACNEMYRVLKKDALMVSFYGWNRVDRFMSAWKMRDSALLVTWSSPKLHIEGRICGLSPRMCLHPGKRPSTSATKPAAGRAGLEIFGQSPSPDGKARYQPATTD